MPDKKKRSIKITKGKVKAIKAEFEKMIVSYTSQETEIETLVSSVSQALSNILEEEKKAEPEQVAEPLVSPLMSQLVNPANITTTGAEKTGIAYHVRTSSESAKADPQ